MNLPASQSILYDNLNSCYFVIFQTLLIITAYRLALYTFLDKSCIGLEIYSSFYQGSDASSLYDIFLNFLESGLSSGKASTN